MISEVKNPMQKKKLIHKYIEEHQTTYQSNYKFHSCFQKTTDVFKFHYYMRDAQLQQIIFSLKLHWENT